MVKKRLTAIVLLLAFSLLAAHSGIAAAYRTMLTRDDGFAFAADGNDIWLIDEKGLWLSKGGTDAQMILEMQGLKDLDAYDGVAYAVYEQEDGLVLVSVDRQGAVLGEWVVPTQDDVISFKVNDAAVLFSLGKEDDGELLLLDLKTGYAQGVNLDGVGPVARGSDRNFLVGQMNAGAVWSVDAQTGQCMKVETKDMVFPMTMHPTDNGIYALLYRGDFIEFVVISDDGEIKLIGEIVLNGKCQGAQITDDHIFLRVDNTLMRYAIRDFEQIAEQKTELVLTGNTMWLPANTPMMREATLMFKELHPDVNVLFRSAKKEDLILSLMAGQNEYDIFVGLSGSFLEYDRADLLADMREYPQIMKEMENWHEIGAMKNAQGEMILLPHDIVELYAYVPADPEALEKCGIGLNGQGVSFEEFTAMAQAAKDADLCLTGDDHRLYAQLMNYCAAHPDFLTDDTHFDTPEFRSLMQGWKELYDSGLLYFTTTEEKYGMDEPMRDILLVDSGYGFGHMLAGSEQILNSNYLCLPSEDGESTAYVDMTCLGMYAHGSQKDLAADYLACYASVRVQTKIDHPGINMHLKDISLYSFGESEMPSEEELSALADFNGQIRIAPTIPELLNRFCQGVAPAYLRGEITLDEMIEEMNETVDIYLYG